MSFTNNAKKNTDKIVELNRNDVFSYGNVIIKILNPTNQIKNQLRLKQYSIEHPDFNSESVVMLIEYANKKVLLTGDSTINNWLEILEKYSDIKSDIVKISHHGSKNNNDYETLANIIKPGGIAIISTDGGVKYPSIPDENVIHMLKTELNCNVYLTSELGYSTIPADIDGDLESDDIIDLYSEIISEPSPIGYYKILISDSGDIQIERGWFYIIETDNFCVFGVDLCCDVSD